jgi:Methyltransferase domain
MTNYASPQESSVLTDTFPSQHLRGIAASQSSSTSTASNRPFASLMRRLKENDLFTTVMLNSFRALQRLGINVTPNHFYWPIPDVAELENREWPISGPLSFDFHFERQVHFLRKISSAYRSEWEFPEEASDHSGGYHYNNGFFETVDAEVAYSLVREYKPSKIIEIGSGFSTRVLSAALQSNQLEGLGGELITIDPIPERLPVNGFSNRVTLIPKRVQDVGLDLFQCLGKNDILFIDSSHVVATGSDVVREYLEILPSLRSGVLVHVHDIFLPSDYPRNMVLKNLCFWSEQYLLQAFLTFNSSFEVLWSSSAMQTFYSQAVEAAFPRWQGSYLRLPQSSRRWVPSADGQRVWPSSFWMKRL